jgi:hypothetical protein
MARHPDRLGRTAQGRNTQHASMPLLPLLLRLLLLLLLL